MQNPILITGCARSGTSMVAGCFAKSGVFFGITSGPNRFNEKGMFENARIRDRIVKPYLRFMGYDPLGQDPLPNVNELLIPPEWHSGVEEVMRLEGYTSGPWGYKGAKMCLIWPVWHTAYPRAKWIIVRRSNQGIINSCLRTSFMRAYKNAQGWQKWVEHHLKCFEEMKRARMDIVEVWSEDIISGNYEELEKAFEHCGVEFDRQTIRNFVAPELFHFKSS